jgi:F-type H+-transporting ATPase subunit b
MESLIDTFHIDAKLIIAQAVNFGVAFLVLYFFALKPLFKTMAERSGKISKGLSDAKESEEKLAGAKKAYENELAKAKIESAAIIEKAVKIGEEKKEEMMEKIKMEVSSFVRQEKEKIKAERAEAAHEIKKEIAGLVALSVEKILEEKTDFQKDAENNFDKKKNK